MKQTILSLLLLALSANLTYGQALPIGENFHKHHVIGLRFGLNQIKEENLVSRVHSGFISGLSYETRVAERNFRDWQLAFGLSRPTARPEEPSTSVNLNIITSASFCFRLVDHGGFICYLGPQARISYRAVFYPNWDESHLYWADAYSAGLKGVSLITFKNDTRLYSTLSFPFLSLYSRPDPIRLYKIDETTFGGVWRNLNRDLAFGSWNRAFYFELNIEYQFPVFRSKLEAFTYTFDLTRIKKTSGRPFTQILHQIGVKMFL